MNDGLQNLIPLPPPEMKQMPIVADSVEWVKAPPDTVWDLFFDPVGFLIYGLTGRII